MGNYFVQDQTSGNLVLASRADLPDDTAMTAVANTPGSAFATLQSATIATATMPSMRPAKPRQRDVQASVITAFQPGHGWTSGGTGITWNLNDTVGKQFGSQCVSAVTGGTGGLSWVQSPVLPTINMTARAITIWVEVTGNLSALQRIQPVITGDGFVSYFQATALYDGTTSAPPVTTLREGELYPLRFTMEALQLTVGTPDKTALNRIRLSWQDLNTGVPVSFRIHRIETSPAPAEYPCAVSFGFDDSYLSTYTRAFPILASRGYAGTAYLIRDNCETPGSTWMSTAQAQDLMRYGWELGAHATSLARHDLGVPSLASSGVLDSELHDLKTWLASIGANGADHFAYPRGWHSQQADPIISRYFALARTVFGYPMETPQPAVPTRTRGTTMAATVTPTSVLAMVDRAIASGGWLQLIFHDIVASGATGNSYNAADLQTIVDGLATRNIPVVPAGDVWRAN